MSSLRILAVGSPNPYLTTGARFRAFRTLGLQVKVVDPEAPLRSPSRLARRLAVVTLRTPGFFAANREILEAARELRPEVIWLEKATYLFPATMRRLRREHPDAVFVYHNTDDFRVHRPMDRLHWRYLLRTLPLYDVYVTSNLHNVREMQEEGLSPVHHMELAANESIRDPGPLSEAERKEIGGPVGFIGHWEENTERLLAALANAGLPLVVYGQGWDHARTPGPLQDALRKRLVWGDDYAKAIVSFDINLGIVSKQNRNHTASRTFQIPMLGAFLLHERNEVVTKYFREGEEAEFFGSADELIEKCRHYLAHSEERRRIAAAGQRRCLASGYSEADRVREFLPLLEDEVRRKRRSGAPGP